MSGSRQSEQGKSVCVRAGRMGNNCYIWGPPSPRSHAAPTIVFPCARRFTNTSSRVVYSNQLALRRDTPTTAATELPGGCCVQLCWEQHLPICVWAARRKCFPCALELVLGTQGAELGPSAQPRHEAGMQCLADCPPPALLQLLRAAGQAAFPRLRQSVLVV